MKQIIATIAVNRQIAKATWEIILTGDFPLHQPGQFVNLYIPGFFLPRPISVCNQSVFTALALSSNPEPSPNQLTLIYKVVGNGTAALTKLSPGEHIKVMCKLGNGYQLDQLDIAAQPVLVGGGVGIPPLFLLAQKLLERGHKPHVILGFNQAAEMFYVDNFEQLPLHLHLCTVDGSRGHKGLVTDALAALHPQIGSTAHLFSCGPLAMMQAIKQYANTYGWKAQFSLEERMGCGFGGCMGCTIHTLNSSDTGSIPARVCKDGPVFPQEVLPW